jgi:polysaccharide export outer membrane protein
MKWALLILIAVPALLTQEQSQTYNIRPGDWLAIAVEGEPGLSRKLQVGSDGMISMPLINDVQAEGLTTDALQVKIRGRLQQYVRDPRVHVTVLGHSSRIDIPSFLRKPKPPETLPDCWPCG